MSGAAASLAKSAGGARGRAVQFKAPLLDRILSTAGDSERRVFALDLGGPSQSLLDKLSQTRPCRVEVADFARCGGLKALQDLESLEEEGPRVIQRLLPPEGSKKLDLIFLWDLPNYMTLEQLGVLVGTLAERVAHSCRLHMLIAYSNREISAQPARYQTGEDTNLIQIPETSEVAEVPRYTQEDLGQVLGDFTYERGVLLTNGMQELVYAWPPEKRPGGRPY